MTRKGLLSGAAFLGALAGYQLLTKGVTGPATAILLFGTLALGIGCCIASEVIAFRERRRGRSEQAVQEEPNSSSDAPSRPEWMGDPASNRRRLLVIVILLAILGALGFGFVWMQ
jgi:hypothetical protein